LFDRRYDAGCRAAPVNAARRIEVSELAESIFSLHFAKEQT